MLPLQAPSGISVRTTASCSSPVASLFLRQRLHNHSRSFRGHITAPMTQLQPVASPSLQQHFDDQHRHTTRTNATTMDVMPAWTPDQIVGMIFFVFMLWAFASTKQVDTYVAKQQRKELGICEACGGIYDAASCQQGECPMRQGQQQGKQ